MRAALLIAPEIIEVGEADPPALAEGEVLIQPMRLGICGTDVSFYMGHRKPPQYPFTLGHELVGRVAAVAPGVSKFSMGQRVIVEPNYPCGNCRFCRSGRGNICPEKRSMGLTEPGCFAERAAAPAEFVWPLPDCVSDEDAATIEPLTVSFHALIRSGVRSGDTVAVIGCGVVGLLLIHVAVAQGLRVLAHDISKKKQEMAASLGASAWGIDNAAGLWSKEDVSFVFECAGVTATVELALGAAPRGAVVMLLGLSSTPAAFVPLRLVREGIRVEPSMIYDHPSDFAHTIAQVANGTLHPSCIVTDVVPFDSIGRALKLASTGQAGKIHAVIS